MSAPLIPDEKLAAIVQRFAAVEDQMSKISDASEIVKLSKEHAELKPIAEASLALQSARAELIDAKEMCAADDKDMVEMAGGGVKELDAQIADLESRLQIMLLPKDKADNSSVILEVRAGTGGDEAALFAGDLFRMYQRYASLNGWKVEILTTSESEAGGYKEVQASISGTGVFAKMKFESGVHRVQRVPETETQGRVHTSAATVAVLPEPEEVDIEIADSDLRVDVFRASGPGGQSVNTTDSAVRITHLPTGVIVIQQDEKSQHKNRAKAMKVLRARLYDMERERADAERAAERRGQIGSGDRSERIRTYNYPQSRVTDHRINLTLYKLDKIIEGEALEELVTALTHADQAERLAAMADEA